jgi:hypothetical protein
VLTLYSPILLHCLSEALRRFWWNVECWWIVLWVVGSSALTVPTTFRSCPYRRYIGKLLWNFCISQSGSSCRALYFRLFFYLFDLCWTLRSSNFSFWLIIRWTILVLLLHWLLMADSRKAWWKVIFNLHFALFSKILISIEGEVIVVYQLFKIISIFLFYLI